MVWNAAAWNGSLNMSPLLQAVQGYRKGLDENYDFQTNQQLGADIAAGRYKDGMQTAAGRGMDPSVLLTLGNKAREDEQRQRQAEMLRNPMLTQGMNPAQLAAIQAMPPEQQPAMFANAHDPMRKEELALKRRMAARQEQPKFMEVNGRIVNPANGQVVYDGGPNFDKLPEFSAKAAGFTSRMVEAEDNTRRITSDPKKFDPTSVGTGLVRSMLPEAIGNVVARSPEMQQYEQSAEQWIRAFLRKESGAAIGKDEFNRDFKVYFPQPGDGPDVVKQKERARLDAMRSFQMETRGFFDHTSPQQATRLKGWQQPQQPNPALNEARDAIQRGAPREKVIERLRQNGIDPSGL